MQFGKEAIRGFSWKISVVKKWLWLRKRLWSNLVKSANYPTNFPIFIEEINLKACGILPNPRLVKESRKTSKSLKDVPAPHRPSLSINAYDRLRVINCSSLFEAFQPFVPNAHFLYPLKTFENLRVFCFLGLDKGCIGNEWVNLTWNMSSIIYITQKTLKQQKNEAYDKKLTKMKDNFCTDLSCEIFTRIFLGEL